MSNVYWADPNYSPVQGKTKVFFYEAKPRKIEKLDEDGVGTGEYHFPQKVHIVKVPGDPKLRIDRPVTRKDKQEYPEEWAQWVKTKESRVLGIPIDSAPFLTDSQKEEFKFARVQTIEQLAELPDAACQKLMGGRELRHKAQMFLNADRSAESQKRIDDLEKKLSELTALMDSKTKPEGKTA